MNPTHSNNPNSVAVPYLAAASAFVSPADIVFAALIASKYDWRSADGLSQETNISKIQVVAILENELSDKVVRGFDQNHRDGYFYTARDHYNEIRGPWHSFLSAVCDQIR